MPLRTHTFSIHTHGRKHTVAPLFVSPHKHTPLHINSTQAPYTYTLTHIHTHTHYRTQAPLHWHTYTHPHAHALSHQITRSSEHSRMHFLAIFGDIWIIWLSWLVIITKVGIGKKTFLFCWRKVWFLHFAANSFLSLRLTLKQESFGF